MRCFAFVVGTDFYKKKSFDALVFLFVFHVADWEYFFRSGCCFYVALDG